MPNKKIIGINFLHTHPYKEKELNIDVEHVIIDKSDLEKIINFFHNNPDEFEKLNNKL